MAEGLAAEADCRLIARLDISGYPRDHSVGSPEFNSNGPRKLLLKVVCVVNRLSVSVEISNSRALSFTVGIDEEKTVTEHAISLEQPSHKLGR